MATTAQGDIMVGSVKNMVDRLSKDFSGSKPPMSLHEPRKPLMPKASTPLVVVTFAYKPTQEDELTLNLGETIEILEEVEDGWSRGRSQRTGAVGMFPTNFVEAKAPQTPPASAISFIPRDDVVIRKSAFPDNSDKPEAIKRTPSVIGVPSTTTVITPPVNIPASAPAYPQMAAPVFPTKKEVPKPEEKTKEMARVKFVYKPEHKDELHLDEIGSLIEIVSKDCGDAGWFMGELNGKRGLFPDNFVELVQVPVSTSTGPQKPASAVKTATKAPLVAPVGNAVIPPAVPAKPLKPKLSDSSSSLNNIGTSAPGPSTTSATTTTSKPVSSNFNDIRNRLAQGLKVVGPGEVPSALSKSTIVTGSNNDHPNGGRPLSTVEATRSEEADQTSALIHITKDRPKPPGKRPMSMMTLRKKGSTENLLESPTMDAPTAPFTNAPTAPFTNAPTAPFTNAPTAPFTTVQAMPVTSSHTTTATVAPIPVKETSTVTSPTHVSMRPSFKEEKKDADRNTTNFSTGWKGLTTQHSLPLVSTVSPSASTSGTGDYVSRREYDDLLARFSALERRLAALESHSTQI